MVALTGTKSRQPEPAARTGCWRRSQGNVCTLVYFARLLQREKGAAGGEKRWVAGKLEQFDQCCKIVHPDHVTAAAPS